jgi:hypothetical protein
MCAAWLVGVLVTMGANSVQPSSAPACVVGADEEDVELMLGQPDTQALGVGAAPRRSVSNWHRIDWLGGWHSRRVDFVDGVAKTDESTYEPFAATPLWLDALRDAFRPRRVPTPGPGGDSV